MFPQHSNKSFNYCNLYIFLLELQLPFGFFFLFYVVWKVKGIADWKARAQISVLDQIDTQPCSWETLLCMQQLPDLSSAQRMIGFQAFEHLHLRLSAHSVSLLTVSPSDLHVGVITLPLSGKCVQIFCMPASGTEFFLPRFWFQSLDEEVKCIQDSLNCFSFNSHFRAPWG